MTHHDMLKALLEESGLNFFECPQTITCGLLVANFSGGQLRQMRCRSVDDEIAEVRREAEGDAEIARTDLSNAEWDLKDAETDRDRAEEDRAEAISECEYKMKTLSAECDQLMLKEYGATFAEVKQAAEDARREREAVVRLSTMPDLSKAELP